MFKGSLKPVLYYIKNLRYSDEASLDICTKAIVILILMLRIQ